MKAYIFPGQGVQFPGMAKELYHSNTIAKKMLDQANEILDFNITQIMLEGTEDELKQTQVTQPAVFLHSVVLAKTSPSFYPDMVAGHSLGEFSALVANGILTYEDGLRLVYQRAMAMQEACEINPSAMAAILGLADEKVEEICASITDETVVPANYNCPGQVVISGTTKGIEMACERMKEAGAKRTLPLSVGGAFHSPLMAPAAEKLETAINATVFHDPICPIYQNVNGKGMTDQELIKINLIAQLTSPVQWTQTIQNMIKDGANEFWECGPGKVLQGLVRKINKDVKVFSV